MKRRGFFGALLFGAPAAAVAGVAKVRRDAAVTEELEVVAGRIRIQGQGINIPYPTAQLSYAYRIKPECFEKVPK